MPVPAPNVLSYSELRKIADAFSQRHWPSGAVPVDVEYIDGFLTADRTTIYIDQAVQDHSLLYRYRFTLAHELAHYHLHGALFEGAAFDSVDTWRRFLNHMPEKSRSWYEWQGYAFAGLLLVPRNALAEKIEDAVDLARQSSFQDLDLDVEAHRDMVAEWVGRRFEVSAEVIVRRGVYDGHWEAK